ncbi:MAG TPA: hypothetical protein DCM40_45165, partial [Maribacter sp.]|nr:hypothetical protein [Maribacter sp.]|tara:strand:+ start:611 stop:1366 length:756 start_codon:yes stop_codon:yes gene_type:complete
MILTEESLRNLISSEIQNQVIIENMRSQITKEDRILVSLLSESESLEEFTDKLSLLNESISSTIAGLLGMTAGGPSRTTEGVWNGLKRWFFGKLVAMLGIKNPDVRAALAAFVAEIEFRELLQIWRGEESACQEIAEAIAQASVFLAAKTLPTQLGADKNTSWGAIMIDQFSEAIKSAGVVEALANQLRETICNSIAELFPKGSKLRSFFSPKTAAAATAGAAVGAAGAGADDEEISIAPDLEPEEDQKKK